MTKRLYPLWITLLFLISVPLKLQQAQAMIFNVDYLAAVRLPWLWLQGGDFPVHGTLSSVAAYNPPGLVWMHLPAVWLVSDGWLSMLLTMLLWQLIGAAALAWLGKQWSPWVGLLAVAAFLYSSIGFQAAWNAWAQFTLPSYFALVLAALVRWQQTGRGRWMALGGVLATLAFMTHFAAIMLFPAMLAFALIGRARWRWRALLIGALVCLGLLAPYVVFQAQRNFADVRAFATRTLQVAPAVVAQYDYLKPGVNPLPWDAPTSAADAPAPFQEPTSYLPPIWDGALGRPLSLALRYAYLFGLALWQALDAIPSVPLVAALGFGAALFGLPRVRHDARLRALWSFALVYVAGMIFTGNWPSSFSERTYFYGLVALMPLLAALGLDALRRWHIGRIAWGLGLLAFISVALGQQGATLASGAFLRDFAQWRYLDMQAAMDALAQDWHTQGGGAGLTVSYDIMSENRQYHWVVLFHSVDASYRMGANYDYLLLARHGLTNRNHDPIGRAASADYVLTLEQGIARNPSYDLLASYGDLRLLRRSGGLP